MTLPSPTGSAPAAALDRVRERALAEGLLDVAYCDIDSPLGPLLAARTARGLACLAYEDSHRAAGPARGVASRASGAPPRAAGLERPAPRLSPRMLEAPARLDDVRRELDE